MKIYSKFIVSSCFLLFSALLAAADLINLSSEQLLSMQQNNALVVDIRTVDEWRQTGVIPGSHQLEFFNAQGAYDADRWLQQLNAQRQSPEQPIILVCRSGNRSKTVGNFLAKQLKMDNIYHLEQGMSEWLKENKPTEPGCANLLACNQ